MNFDRQHRKATRVEHLKHLWAELWCFRPARQSARTLVHVQPRKTLKVVRGDWAAVQIALES